MDEITEVKLNGKRYSLRRESDGRGDSGMMLNAICPKEFKAVDKGVIKVGYAVQCGSPFARTMDNQDWWCTTPVSKILSVNDDKTEVRFKTGNSIYICRVI